MCRAMSLPPRATPTTCDKSARVNIAKSRESWRTLESVLASRIRSWKSRGPLGGERQHDAMGLAHRLP